MRVAPVFIYVLMAAGSLMSGGAMAGPYAFTSLPLTGAAINDLGIIGGQASPNVLGGHFPDFPALYDGTTIVPQNVGFSNATTITGLNNAGDFVGLKSFGVEVPYEVLGGVVTAVAAPADPGSGVFVSGINNKDQIVGSTLLFTQDRSVNPLTPPSTSTYHGFISSGGSVTGVDVPGAATTQATGINDSGEVVGSFGPTIGTSDPKQGFLLNNGAFTTVDRPGAFSTFPLAVNNAGEIIGFYTDAAGARYGFVDVGNQFTDLILPNGSAFLPFALNNLGQIVGSNYLATPSPTAVPEPASAVLLAGAAAVALTRRIRRR